MLGMLGPISPNVLNFNYILIAIFYFFIFLHIILNNVTTSKINFFILVFFIPGLFLTFKNSPENLIRFIPFFFLLFSHPFLSFNIKFQWIRLFSLFILIYLIFTQTILAYGNDTFSNFREIFYPNKDLDHWRNRIAPMTESIFESFTEYRASGLFYNPNIMGSVVLLYYIFYSLSDDCIKKKYFKDKKNLIFFYLIETIVMFSILFSFSRTIIISYIAYIFLKNLKLNFFRKENFFLFIIIIIIICLSINKIINGFNPGDSQSVKINLFINYFQEANIFNIIFGGVHTNHYMFDQDIGNWLGAVGLFGFLGFVLFLKKISHIILLRPLILVILLISAGAGALYGLFTSSIIIPLFIVAFCYSNKFSNSKKI
jgi:hypothetical protein